MLSNEDARMIEVSAPTTTDPPTLLRWIDALLRDTRDRVRAGRARPAEAEAGRVFRDVIGRGETPS